MSLNGVAEIDKALDMLSKASARSFLKIWASAPSREKAALIEYLTPNLLALIEAGHEEASTLALEQIRREVFDKCSLLAGRCRSPNL